MPPNLQEGKSIVDIFEIDASACPRPGPADPVLKVHGRVDRIGVHSDLVPDVRRQILALKTEKKYVESSVHIRQILALKNEQKYVETGQDRTGDRLKYKNGVTFTKFTIISRLLGLINITE